MAVDLTDIQTLHVKMNDNAPNNVVTNDGTGTLTLTSINATTQSMSVPGKINTAFDFDSVDERIQGGYDASLDTAAGSIAFWAIKDGTATNKDCVFSFYNTAVTSQFNARLYMVPPHRLNLGGTAIGAAYIDTALFDGTDWVHVVITQDGGVQGLKVYLNGVDTPLDSNTIGTNWISTETYEHLSIGARVGGDTLLDGSLDDFRIFNQALTQDEVDFLYNDGNGTELNAPPLVLVDKRTYNFGIH